jgi:radical SAM superfamily enzyme YgiQ (UPF0313 family)
LAKSIYLIHPVADFPSYFSAEVFAARGLTPTIAMADLAIATIAAMAPGDFAVRLCDETVSQIDFNTSADFVGITGKVSQWGRMKSIAHEFRRRGRTVLIGGPYASLSPEVVRPHCDILVRGEIEDIAPQIFADLRSGIWLSEYIGTKPDLRRAIMPRWDLYPNDRALMGSVQTSRGCPFECEFCDVIEYLGRKQRHKPIANVLAELDELYRLGYRAIYLADDNFTVFRSRTKELLTAIRDWNAQQLDGNVHFATQVSVDAAGDVELLQLCADAGLTYVFIGVETPNEESLRESKKRQNLKKNLSEEIQRFIDYGISVDCGMIVGFDGDDLSIFRRQYEFAMATAVPIFSLGMLVAPAATPLYARLAKEGRLTPEGAEVAAAPWSTNINPKQMTRDQLYDGIRWLCNSIYRPEAFEERATKLIHTLGSKREALDRSSMPKLQRSVDVDAVDLIRSVRRLGPAEDKMLSSLMKKLLRNREATRHIMGDLVRYSQVRYMYECGQLWQPSWPENSEGTLMGRRAAITAASPVPV